MLLIALTLYVLLMFQFLLIAISMVLQSIFLIKTSILVFTIAVDCVMMSGNIKKLTCWHPKVVEILTIWISCPSFSYFCFLLIFWENGKMILASKLFLLVSLFKCAFFIDFQNLITCQFFTHDTIEITNEVNTSHSQS